MEVKIENIKKLFEEWIVNQMGEHIKSLIDQNCFHNEDGYHDQIVNAMWIGFNAGVELGPLA